MNDSFLLAMGLILCLGIAGYLTVRIGMRRLKAEEERERAEKASNPSSLR